MATTLEHANITVSDPRATAAWMREVFGWTTRWEGATTSAPGYSVHVGDAAHYIALYAPEAPGRSAEDPARTVAGLNHLAVVTDDLGALEARVRKAGFAPHHHADYEPGRRFYFRDGDGIEYEAVSYS